MDLWDFPAIDQHAHNILNPDAATALPYAAAFTEAHDPEVVDRHARHTLFFHRSLRDIADLLECEATEQAILARREQLGLVELTRRCFRAARLEAVLLDDGFLPEQILPLDWHAQFVPVRRLLRIEMVAEKLLTETTSFDDFLDRFCSALDPPPANVAGFKSIAAYRSGLAIQPVTHEAAATRFVALVGEKANQPIRLTDKSLIDFLFLQALEIAAKHKMPMQLHTGFGDPDLDLRLANPLHLRPVLEDRRFRQAPLVLLHAGYPFVRECGFLASVYRQVYLDLGLAVPLLSVSGMRTVASELLELAPYSKLMYSSDAHFIPELYFLAAKWGREVLGQVLDQAVRDGDLTATTAEQVARRVLAENARVLYRLDRIDDRSSG